MNYLCLSVSLSVALTIPFYPSIPGFERLVPGYPRYYYEGDPTRGEHHLLITGVTLTEDGEYQCQVGPTAVSPPIWTAANVTVICECRVLCGRVGSTVFVNVYWGEEHCVYERG